MSTARFDRYFRDFYLPHETVFARGHSGDYAYARSENVDGDAGGLTKFGIDQRSHPKVDIERLTLDQAERITFLEDWCGVCAEQLPAGWGEALTDIKVNGGHGAVMAQEALNSILPPAEQLTVDGVIGLHTHAAMEQEGKAGLLALLACRESYYRELAKRKPSNAKFLEGWLNRNNDLRAFVLQCLHDSVVVGITANA
jgi:lysozyme family protein